MTSGNNTLNGNQTVDGTVSASSFVGSGAGLSNVIASGVGCTSCIGNMQLGINYAGSTSQGGPASNSLLLNGFASSAFATTGANLFTGNQSITGSLSVTANSATTGTTTLGSSGTPIVRHLSATINPTFVPTKGFDCVAQNFTFTGANDGDTIALGVPNERMTANDVIYTAWVSAPNTVTIRACVINVKPKTFGSGAIRVDIWQH